MAQSTLSKNAILSAITQLGVQEIPKNSNAGLDVEKYLKSVGLGKGYSWCMAFVFWNVQQAADNLKAKNPLLKTGGVMVQYNYDKNKKFAKPSKGDIFIMDFGNGAGHTGFVEYVLNDTIHTIEGNTNDEGSREGYEVCRRIRKISSIKSFIKF